MTRTLHLHIGLGKTGSSALQSWLSLNATTLARGGLHYADLAPEAKEGAITSGNGYPLWTALKDGDTEGARQLLREDYFGGGAQRAIVSCEHFQHMQTKHILALKGLCRDLDIDVQVVAFVRSVYEHCHSIYGQGVKRAGFGHAFGSQDSDLEGWLGGATLSTFSLYFPGRVAVLNYDDSRRDIFQAFATAVPLPPDLTPPLDAHINRGLSSGELEAMRELNANGGAPFCTAISDFLLERFPSRSPAVEYDAAMVERVEIRYRDEVAWINLTFDLKPPLLTHRQSDRGRSSREDYAESLDAVAAWALAYTPREPEIGPFAEFLNSLAGHPRFTDTPREAGLRSAATAMSAAARELPDGSAQSPRRFLFAYLPADEALAAAAGPDHQRELARWLAKAGALAIGSTLNLVGDTQRANPASPHQADLSGVSACSLLEMASLEEALALARDCPALRVGGDIWVFELEPMPYQ